MQLLVFQTPFAGELIKLFQQAGLVPLVDAVHVDDTNWLKQSFDPLPHKCFHVNGDGDVSAYRAGQGAFPSFVWYYNITDKIYETDWFFIKNYVQYLLKGEVMHPTTQRGKQLLQNMVHMLPVTQEEAAGDLEPDMDLDEDQKKLYSFREYYNEDRDVGLFEIGKPFTDNPYTVVIREFKRRGYEPLFTSLYICDSWGVSRFDAMFLDQLWNHLKMPGSLELETLLYNATQQCYPAEGKVPEAEPEVYRRSLETVLKDFDKRECGH